MPASGFTRQKAMAAAARDEVDLLKARLDALDGRRTPEGEAKDPPAGVTGVETPEE